MNIFHLHDPLKFWNTRKMHPGTVTGDNCGKLYGIFVVGTVFRYSSRQFTFKPLLKITRLFGTDSTNISFRHVLWSYRQKNPGTKVGEPPPYGKTGFNSGVKLVNLHEMRNNRVYNELLQSENISKIASKYEFKGHLGDQDFYSLISFDYSDMFYTLPCQWNRQLCTWWKNNGYQDVFDLYFKCNPPFHVLHGNCNTPIPED